MNQLSLFDDAATESLARDFLGVAGLIYATNVLEPAEQSYVLNEIDARPWQNDLKRRVQHYGYKYDYKARNIDRSMYVGPFPDFATEVVLKLVDMGLVERQPDQMIVNEYLPGQGITAHVDCVPCFDDTIITVSVGSAYEMEFICLESGERKAATLEVGSALVMTGDARFKWTHAIRGRKSDNGIPRGRRVSLTFRNVILDED